jgi:hypothetical protein
VLLQNCELREQLAKLKDGFIELTNDNVELTSALLSVQHIREELVKMVGQLQETLGDVQEAVKMKRKRLRVYRSGKTRV